MERVSRRVAMPVLIVASLSMIAISGYKVWRGWNTAIEAARVHTQNQALMLEEHARQVLIRVQMLLRRADAEVAKSRTLAAMSGPDGRQRLESLIPDDRLVQALIVLDRSGNVVATTEQNRGRRRDTLAGMDYFARHAGVGSDREFVFGAPETAVGYGQAVLPVSRRISGKNGAFDGVIVAMVRASNFQRIYNTVADTQQGAASLFSTSGIVWVASQRSDAAALKTGSEAHDALMRHVRAWPTGTVDDLVLDNDAPWVFSHRVLGDLQFVVTFGLPHAVVFAVWKNSVWQDVLLLIVAVSTLGGIVAILNRKERLRREAEASLEKSELLFRNLTEKLPDGIVRVDTQCRHLFMNEAAMRVAGFEGNSPLGRTLDEIFPKEMSEAWQPLQASVQRVVDHAVPDVQEFAWPNGRTMEVRHFPEFDAQGRVVSVLGIARDITERKHTEQALVERERQFRTLADNMPDNVIRYDAMGRETYRNAAMKRTFGELPVEAKGKTPTEIAPSSRKFIAEYEEILRRVLLTGEPAVLSAEVDYGRVCGRTLHICFAAERDESNRVVGAVVIGRDITDLKHREWELEQSRDMLRELVVRNVTAREDERKNIAREIHDELGQVLTALRLDIATLQYQFGNDTTVSARCQQLLNLTDATIRTVRNVILALRPSVLDMGLMPALDWLVSDILKRNGIACSLEVDGNCMDMDEARLLGVFRIVQESLTNILRHADAREVVIELKGQYGMLLLTIRDDGKGFDLQDVRGKSFGLVGVRERALMMGGRARIDSAPGQGTIVRVELPCGSC